MASFDILSKVDSQFLDNAINVTKKEVMNRYDFKDSVVNVDLNKKDNKITMETSDDMKMRQLVEILINKANKQGISPLAFDISKDPYPSGKTIKQDITVKNGLKQEDAKKVTKLIKDSGLKVQTQIMDDIIRVTGKKIDDLQDVIKLIRENELGFPTQFENMKS